MRKLLITILAMAVSVALWAQNNPTINAIKNNTLTTAKNTTKGGFDYLTLSISLLAFFIAGITLYYTVKTYHSQKKTESNTTKFSAKQERIELRHLAMQLINNAHALFRYDQHVDDDNVFGFNGRIYEDFFINVDRLHADTFMGEGVDYSDLYEFSILANKYNDMLSEKKRLAECRLLKRESVLIGEERYDCSTYREIQMTWKLFKRLYRLYNEGMLTDEERKQLLKDAQGAELQVDLSHSPTIEDVFDELDKKATFAQQCALETDLTFPYRMLADAWEKEEGKLLDLKGTMADYVRATIFYPMLLSDESKDGKALRDYFYTAVFCASNNFERNYMQEEKVTAEKSIITSYVITEEGEYHAYLDCYDFANFLDGKDKGFSLHIDYGSVRQMLKSKNILPESSDQQLNALKPDQTIKLTADKLLPLGTLVLTTVQGGLMHTMRIKVLNHSIELRKKTHQYFNKYIISITLQIETGHILNYERFPFDEEKYRFFQI